MTQTKTKVSNNSKLEEIGIDTQSILTLNSLKPYNNSTKNRKRLGRGNASGYGGECGRGHKGQKSRSGFSRKRGFEGGQNPLYKRIPKKRGFKNIFKIKYRIINLSNLNLNSFNETLELKHLIDFGMVTKNDRVKFVGSIPIDFKLKSIETHSISHTLKSTLEKKSCAVILLT